LIEVLASKSDTIGQAGDVGVLSARAARLGALVEFATPMAERTALQLGRGHEALDRGVLSTTDPEQFQQFWAFARTRQDALRPRKIRERHWRSS